MMIVIFLICLNALKSIEIQTLDPYYQVAYQSVKIDNEIFQPNQFFSYGLWSRYNPLSAISQVGPVGIFGSNCYQLLNIIDKVDGGITFMYFDCLHNEKYQITKEIKFVNDNGEQKVYETQIEAQEYESFWYFLEIIQWPIKKRFEIFIISQKEQKFFIMDEMKSPFKGKDLQLTFGGSLIVSKSKIESVIINQKFSYFPGKIIMQQFKILEELSIDDWFEYAKSVFEEYETCNCSPNQEFQIPDLNISSIQKGEFVSENKNCNSFFIQGWFKIQQIMDKDYVYLYPFIKLAGNFENPNLSSNNLSPVQVFYKLSNIQHQILITTYSFTFPSVTIDFQANPFLIEKTFDIVNSITLWHKIQIQLENSLMDIQIKFYDNYMIHEYNQQLEVRQFQENQFKLQLGNYQQLEINQVDLLIRNFVFFNCNQSFSQNNCHYTCQECDGPTKDDCLSCSEESKRIYLPEYKVCVCPLDTIDNLICIDYVVAQMMLIEGTIEGTFINQECQYGYYELDDECQKCPSIINQYLITCLECIYNPKSFSKKPYCADVLSISQTSQTENVYWQLPELLLFDGIDQNNFACVNCDSLIDNELENIYFDFTQKSLYFRSICITEEFRCYQVSHFECPEYHLSIAGIKCSSKKDEFENFQGQFNPQFDYIITFNCQSPNYITNLYKCKLCPIKNCIYCFEYQQGDSSFKSTLYKDFENFEIDQSVSIGCAMCEQNYIFDFTIGECIKQQSKIQTCLRSFINLNGQEICTLSSLNDFSISPEIINCQKYYSNCLQCVLTPKTKIQCIHCSQGYFSSLITGDCIKNYQLYINENTYSHILTDGQRSDTWVVMIQSFMMQFLPSQYYYPHSLDSPNIYELKCKDGYQFTKLQSCQKYCSNDCLNCQQDYERFNCMQCSLNYYKKPIRVEKDGQCVSCSHLCQYCQERDEQEIYAVQPSFVLTNENAKYTMKCIKPLEDPKIFINPYTSIVKYCLNESCQNHLSYIFYFSNCIFNRYVAGGYEEEINFQYSNLIGVDEMTIEFIINIQFQEKCQFHKPLQILTQLKKQIFSLQKINLNLFSIYENIYYTTEITEIINFDSIIIQNVSISLQEDGFILRNNNNKVEITLKNIILTKSNIIEKTVFQSQVFGNIQIDNFNIEDSIIQNSFFFDYQNSQSKIFLKITKLSFRNCQLRNSTLFQINDNQIQIDIQDIIIENCLIVDSSFFSVQTNQINLNKVILQGVEILGCNFSYSYFIKIYNGFSIIASNLYFHDNQLQNSILIAFNDNIELIQVKTNKNILIKSSIISTLQIVNQQKVLCIINDFEDSQTNFQESSMIIIYPNLQINNYIVNLKNIKVQGNQIVGTKDQQIFLFKFHCHNLFIENTSFQDLNNLVIFYLFEIMQIVLENVRFVNSKQQYKVPLSQECTQSIYIKNQLLKLAGFQFLQLENIYIINVFSNNYSLMDIIFSNYFIIDQIGQVYFKNIQFKENILLKNQQAVSLSLLSLYSQHNLKIKLSEIVFIQNIIHQQIDDSTEEQTSLLYINSLNSIIQIDNLYCSHNALTNSTNSYLSLSANLIEIKNFNIFNQNILSQNQWQQFYEFVLDDQFNQEEINTIIQSTLKILNQGILIIASNFSCTNCQFQDILTVKSSIFEIRTKGQGLIILNNLQINSIMTNLRKSESSGCITIVSTNSFLNLQLERITFKNIFNRMNPSLFTISPSSHSNVIKLNNIIIENCLSLVNTILFLKVQNEAMQSSLVSINDLTIFQSEEQWLKLFSKIGVISKSEMNIIKSENNGLILIENCKVEINNFNFEGISISSILTILNTNYIKISDCKITNVQQLYSFDLIHLTQATISQSIILIQQLKIIQSSIYDIKQDKIPIFQDYNYQIIGCDMWKNSSIQEQIVFSEIKSQFQSSDFQFNQMIYVNSKSELSSIIFYQIDLIDNNESQYSKGIITFVIEKFKKIYLDNIICYQNSVKQNGCINLLNSNFINSTIRIKDSYFIKNTGSLGAAIQIANVRLNMKNCKIIQNYASEFGGGMHLQLKDNYFQIKSTIITNNTAQDGGGIYFKDAGKLTLTNFIQSFLLFNQAFQFGNNLIESPHHLALIINNKEMKSRQQVINKIMIEYLILKQYKIIEQGTPLIKNFLMIPSNQVILTYKIYEPQSLQYFSYISNLGLILKNSLNEKLKNYLNSTCTLITKVIDGENLNQEGKLNEQKNLQYDIQEDYYDLGSYSFTFDPYNEEQKRLQIQINCFSDQVQKIFGYVMLAKSLKCQLGEFYVNSGCQICQSSQGFYSVVYDAPKCSIFDKTKFKNITENNIELLEGFWRPDYLSDLIEQCFKNLRFCKGGWGYGDLICSQGRIGALCEECDIYNIRGDGKYFKNQQDSECISCFGVSDSIIPFIASSIWSFLSIIITLRSIEESNQLFKSLVLIQKYGKILFKLNQGHESFFIKMLLNYLWIFSAIFTFNIQFSFSFTFIDSASNTSQSMTNNLDCYLSESQSIKLIYTKIITMLSLMSTQFILVTMGFLIYFKHKKLNLSFFYFDTISNSLLYLYVSNYGGLIKMYFSILSRREISNQNYIQGDVSLLFGTREHLIWMFFFVIPGIAFFCLIIPLSLYILMYVKRHDLETIKIRKNFCYLINEYENKTYFWEIIKLIKKTIMILILTYFETHILLKASLLGLCLLFYQLIAVKNKPFNLQNLNNLDLFSGQICSIAIFLAAAKYVSEQENNQFSSKSLQTFIVLLCIRLCYPFISNISGVYFKNYYFLIINKSYQIMQKISKKSRITTKLSINLQMHSSKKKRQKELIKKLRQYLMRVSKSQLQNNKIMLSTIRLNPDDDTLNSQSKQKYRNEIKIVDSNQIQFWKLDSE